jgi:predicted Zn-dependent protease
LRVQIDQRTARATTNRLDDASIRQVVEETIALTKLQEPDPALLPLAEPTAATECPQPAGMNPTALVNPSERAEAVAEAIRIVEAAGQTAAGIYSTSERRLRAPQLARRLRLLSRDHGAVLHHRHGFR